MRLSAEGLLPCPFCGGPGNLGNDSHDPSGWCGYCAACDFSLEFVEGRENAIERWNTRAAPPTQGDPTNLLALLKTDRDNAIKDGAQSAGVFVETLDRVIGWIEDSVASLSPSAQVSPSRVSEQSSEAGGKR